jgi:membrane-associated phospholipid phosphatase
MSKKRIISKRARRPQSADPLDRRAFFKATATTAAAAAVPAALLAGQGGGVPAIDPDQNVADTYAPLTDDQLRDRRRNAFLMRQERARHWLQQQFRRPLANDDELRYPAGWANFSKSLPHDQFGNPDPAAFAALVRACQTGEPADFAAIPLGGTQPLRNPQGSLSFEFCGVDSNQTIVPPAPAFGSAWRAAEMVEVYWTSLLRDVPFSQYGTNVRVTLACADLTAMRDYRGPKLGGLVTPNLLFRGHYPGCLDGPFISQFLLKDIAFGSQVNTQQVKTFAPGIDYLTGYAEWVVRQNGGPFGPRVYDLTRRYIRTLRDLIAWVDADPPLQAGYHALSILLQMGARINPGNPYANLIRNQDAFTTFGPVEWFDLVGRAARPAHEAAWFQKWRIHRVLRPEEFAGRIHNHVRGSFQYPIHSDVLASRALHESMLQHGTGLCSQAYPDGAPTHCAYPSGHSVGSGSTATMLKAIFDENFVIPDPVEPTPDGLSLRPYVGPPLTVGGELNKLAFNIGIGRVAGGIHWRSDVVQGNALGEATSLSILADMGEACSEPFSGYTLTKFDGSRITT